MILKIDLIIIKITTMTKIIKKFNNNMFEKIGDDVIKYKICDYLYLSELIQLVMVNKQFHNCIILIIKKPLDEFLQ